MAVYEYLCPKCRNEFELTRPMSEAEKPANCPKCGSKAQKLISGFGSKTGDSIQPAGEPLSKRTVVEEVVLESPHGEGRDMAQESLLQMLEKVASRIKLLEREKSETAAKIQALEREKNEAVATAQALEREVGELVDLITLAGAKLEEILKVRANDEISQPQAVNVPAESKSLERLGEFSPDSQKQPKRLLPHAFIPD
jgi:putative FmdB family regulatory protein